MHSSTPEDALLIGGSLAGMAFAATYAWELFRR
jgi:hypothetical protein